VDRVAKIHDQALRQLSFAGLAAFAGFAAFTAFAISGTIHVEDAG